MAIATLSAIIDKVRKLTLSPNSSNITDAQIIDYINSFYLFDFPAEFRSLDLKNLYTFNTIKGIDTYPFDIDHWINIQEPVFCAKRQIKLFSDPGQFNYFQLSTLRPEQMMEIIGTGDGSETEFPAELQDSPLLRSINNNPIVQTKTSPTAVQSPSTFPASFQEANIGRIQNLLITVNLANGSTLNVTDDGAGNLIGDVDPTGTNTIDYDTGILSVKFTFPPPDGEDIICEYLPVTLNTPLAVLFFQNELILRPVPDKGYTIELTGYRTPSQALLGTGSTTNYSGRPEEREWWECLAVGASKKIYEDRLDAEGIQMMDKMLMERYQVCYARTYANLGKQRIATIYSDQLNYTYGSGPFGIGNF